MAFRWTKPFLLNISPVEASALYDIFQSAAPELDDDQQAFVSAFLARMKKHAEHKSGTPIRKSSEPQQ